MLLLLIVVLVIILLLTVYLPKNIDGYRRTSKKNVRYSNSEGFSLQGEVGKIQGSRHQKNLIQLRILSGEVTRVSELNSELELCKAFDNSTIPAALVDKILEITLQDETACSIEKLISLEYIKGTIQSNHLASLKQLFICHGLHNYLLAIEIFNLIKRSDDSTEKSVLLNFISQQVELPEELINNRLSADARRNFIY